MDYKVWGPEKAPAFLIEVGGMGCVVFAPNLNARERKAWTGLLLGERALQLGNVERAQYWLNFATTPFRDE